MFQFSLFPYNAHSQNLSFRSKETIATDKKCSLFPNITCDCCIPDFFIDIKNTYALCTLIAIQGGEKELSDHYKFSSYTWDIPRYQVESSL